MTQTYVFPTSVASKIALPSADVSKALKELPIAVINSAGDFNNISTEFACSFEYINKFGENKSVQSDGGFGAFGNVSIMLPKKNYRVKFSTSYGVKNLKYKIFERSADENYDPIDDIGGLDFRAGHDATGGDISGMMMSDYLMRKLMHKLGSKDVHVRFVHLFFNGQYHGVYAVREHFTPEYVETYYGGNEETAELVKGEEVGLQWGPRIPQQGTGALWDAVKADSDNKNFQGLKAKMDVPHFINFMMVFLLGGQETEFKAVTNAGFNPKMIVYFKDVDAFMNGSGRGATNYKTFNLAYNGQGPGNLMAMTGIAGGTVNREYQTMAKDRIRLAMLQTDGALTAANLNALVTQASNILTPVIAIDYARWQNISPSYFASQVNKIKADMPTKVNDVINYYRTYNLIHTLNPVTFSKPSGKLAVVDQVTIANPNASTTVYYSLNGDDVVFDNGIASWAKAYTVGQALPLKEGKNVIKARAYTNGNFGPLTEVTYIVAPSINITGINYNAVAATSAEADKLEFVLVTNYGTEARSVAGDSVTAAISFAFPAGTVLNPGETVMITKDLTKYPSLTLRKFLWTSGKLANEGEKVIYKTAAGEIINEFTYLPTAPWPTAANGGGSYLKLKTANLDNSKPENWEAATFTTAANLASQPTTIKAYGLRDGNKAVVSAYINNIAQVDYITIEKYDETAQEFKTIATFAKSQLNIGYISHVDGTPSVSTDNLYRFAMYRTDSKTPQYSDVVTLDFSHLIDYTVYPNPTAEYVDININQSKIEHATIRIVSFYGQVVWQQEVQNVSHNLRLDVEKWEAGQYFILLDIKGKRSISKKLTIMR